MITAIFIEDRSLMLRMLRDSVDWVDAGIEPLGFFSSCDEALPIILEKDPDVVVTDIVMYGMDGLQLCQRLNATQEDGVKVILISAYSRFEYAQKALQMGVYDYFEKPVDFEQLKRSIVKAGEKRIRARQVKQYVERHMSIYRERFFNKLLLGLLEGQLAYLAQQSAFLKLDPDAMYICAAIRIERRDMNEKTGGEQREMAHLMLHQRFQEALGTNPLYGPYSLRENDMAIIVGCGDQRFHDLANDVVNKFSHDMRATVHMGIGQPAKGLLRAKDSYDEACRARASCFNFSDTMILSVRDIPQDETMGLYGFIHFEAQIVRALEEGDEELASLTFERLRERMEGNYLDRDTQKVLMKSILLKAQGVCLRDGDGLKYALRQIDQAQAMDELIAIAKRNCADIAAALRANRNDVRKRLVKEICGYIEEHYAQGQLSLIELAQTVSLSPNYLSSLFKREFGKGANEYITQLRIEKACQMLSQTDRTIAQISEQVGYTNPYYFSGSFKKVMNMSPTQYRNRTQNIQ